MLSSGPVKLFWRWLVRNFDPHYCVPASSSATNAANHTLQRYPCGPDLSASLPVLRIFGGSPTTLTRLGDLADPDTGLWLFHVLLLADRLGGRD